MNRGVKKVAPSTPDAIATVAIKIAMGNMNQNSKVIDQAILLRTAFLMSFSSSIQSPSPLSLPAGRQALPLRGGEGRVRGWPAVDHRTLVLQLSIVVRVDVRLSHP
jgi:hypothetical protein